MNRYFRQIVFSIGLLLIGLSKSFAQSDTVNFFIDTVEAVASIPIEVPIRVSSFESVVGFQFSMEWNTDTLTFDSIGNLNLFGLVLPQFNLLNTDNGVLTLSWNDPNVFNGITVADSTAIFSLFFEAFPGCDSTAQLRFIETPTSFDVTLVNDNNQVVQVPYSFGDGVIEARCPILEADFAMNGDSIQDLRVCAPFELILTDSSFGELGINQWTWDAGNGQMSTDTNTTFLYEVPGTFSASLIIEDDFSIDTVAFEVIVDPVVDVDFTFQLDPCGSTFVSFNGINNGTSNIIAWDWDFGNNTSNTGQNTFQAYNEYDTDYTVVLTVTDQNGCMSSVEKVVNIPFVALVEADPFEIQLPGCDTASGQIILETTGGLAPYTYVWSHDNTLTDSIAAGLSPGDYTVTVTDALGCIGTTTTFLTSIDSFPVVDLGLDTSFCIGGSINLDAGEEGEAYEWLLDDNTLAGALNSILSANQTGTYIANVTNEFNCTTSDTLVLDVFELPEVHLGADTTICESDTLTLNAETDASIFNWSLNNNSLNEDGQSLEVNQAGTYTVEVTDHNACSNTDEIVIVFSDPPIIELGADTTICEGEDILLQVPDEGYDYEWYLNQNTLVGSTNVLSTNLEGDYALIATNQDGCKFEDEIELEVVPLPIVDLGLDTIICEGSSLVLNAENEGSNFSWFVDDQLIDNNTTNQLTVIDSGTFSILVEDSNACLGMDEISIEVEALPLVEISLDRILCEGDTLSISDVELAMDTTNTNSWVFNGEMMSLNSEITNDGMLTAVVASLEGCSAADSILIAFQELPATELPGDTLLCPNDSLLLVHPYDDEYEYVWFLEQDSIGNENQVWVSHFGEYSFYIKDENGCERKGLIGVGNGFSQNFFFETDTIVSCDTLPVPVEVLSEQDLINLNLEWSLNDSILLDELNEPQILIDSSGVIKLEISNQLGCIYELEQEVIFEGPVIFNFPPDSTTFCNASVYPISVEHDLTFTNWYYEDELIDLNSINRKTINANATGNYWVEVEGVNGCVFSDSVYFIQFPPIEFDLGLDSIKACLGEDIILDATDEYISYGWRNVSLDTFLGGSSSITISTSGLYSVRITTTDSCQAGDFVFVDFLEVPELNILGEETRCTQDTANINVSNGTLLNYQWQFNTIQLIDSSYSLMFQGPGTYIVTGYNEADCSASDTLHISISEVEELDILGESIFCESSSILFSQVDSVYPHEWTLNDQLIQSSAVDSLVVTQAGTYTVTVFNEDNCSASDTIIITQGEIPDIDLGNDLELCEEELANFLVNEGYMYTWLLDGEEIDDETGNTLTTDKSGTYMVVATSEDGCESTDEAEVIIHPLPEIELGMDASICPEDSYNLDASCVDCEVVWNDGNTDDVRDINMAGEYIATVTNEFDCSVVDTFNLSLYEAAMPDLGEDIELCLNESVTLDPGFFSTYQWSIGTDAPSIDLFAADVFAGAIVTYWVDVSTPDGCVGSDSITVTYLPLINSLIEAPADNICLGDSLQLLATGGTFYEWSDINGNTVSISDPFSQRPTVTPTENTTYQVIVGNDCPTDLDTAYYEVAVLELPNGDAGQDTCIAEGTDIFLNATGGETYLWESNEIYPLSNLESPTPRGAPIESTTYFVTITGLNGCSISDSVLVAVAEDPSFNVIPVNIITPNGDGKNDFLEFDNLEKFPRNTLKVYNRWGNKVYEKVGYENDWDGTYQGKPLPAGSYYYILSFQASQVVVKSVLTILRE